MISSKNLRSTELDPCDPRQYIASSRLRTKAPDWVDKIGWSKFREKPLPPAIQKGVRFIFAVEAHTPAFALIPALNKHNYRSPERSAVRASWEVDEFWHAAAAYAVLRATDRNLPDFEELRRQDIKKNERFGHVTRPLKSMGFNLLIPREASGGTNIIGAMNKKVTGSLGYTIIAELSGHDEYKLLNRYVAQEEAIHAVGYEAGAHQDLDGHPRSQKVARFIVDRFGGMPGYQVFPKPAVDGMINLMAQHENFMPRVEQVDRSMQKLPGMERATTMQDFIEPRLAA